MDYPDLGQDNGLKSSKLVKAHTYVHRQHMYLIHGCRLAYAWPMQCAWSDYLLSCYGSFVATWQCFQSKLAAMWANHWDLQCLQGKPIHFELTVSI